MYRIILMYTKFIMTSKLGYKFIISHSILTSKFPGNFMLMSMSLLELPNSLADDPNNTSSAPVML